MLEKYDKKKIMIIISTISNDKKQSRCRSVNYYSLKFQE